MGGGGEQHFKIQFYLERHPYNSKRTTAADRSSVLSGYRTEDEIRDLNEDYNIKEIPKVEKGTALYKPLGLAFSLLHCIRQRSHFDNAKS